MYGRSGGTRQESILIARRRATTRIAQPHEARRCLIMIVRYSMCWRVSATPCTRSGRDEEQTLENVGVERREECAIGWQRTGSRFRAAPVRVPSPRAWQAAAQTMESLTTFHLPFPALSSLGLHQSILQQDTFLTVKPLAMIALRAPSCSSHCIHRPSITCGST